MYAQLMVSVFAGRTLEHWPECSDVFISKTRLLKYAENFTFLWKNWNFSDKTDIFHISA